MSRPQHKVGTEVAIRKLTGLMCGGAPLEGHPAVSFLEALAVTAGPPTHRNDRPAGHHITRLVRSVGIAFNPSRYNMAETISTMVKSSRIGTGTATHNARSTTVFVEAD